MDTAVKPTDRTTRAGRPGRIVVVRHGRPQVIPKEGPPMGWRDYKDWWDRYELSSLKDGQRPPEALLKERKVPPNYLITDWDSSAVTFLPLLFLISQIAWKPNRK